eukprot:917587-Pyramimonas_sp.AAC.1
MPGGLRSVKLSPPARPAGGGQHNDVLRGLRLDLAIDVGLRSVKLSPRSRPAEVPSTVTSYGDSD